MEIEGQKCLFGGFPKDSRLASDQSPDSTQCPESKSQEILLSRAPLLFVLHQADLGNGVGGGKVEK